MSNRTDKRHARAGLAARKDGTVHSAESPLRALFLEFHRRAERAFRHADKRFLRRNIHAAGVPSHAAPLFSFLFHTQAAIPRSFYAQPRRKRRTA